MFDDEEILKEITTPKNEEKIDLKKIQEQNQRPIERSDKSIITTKEVININHPPYQTNKKKYHCMLYILKQE